MEDRYQIEFYYEGILIGVGYGLTEEEADGLWEEWESFKEQCWCAIVFVADEYDE